MAIHTTVKTLLEKGVSRRKIAEQLGLHRNWVFCMVLSHSRLGYFEAVTDQSVEAFIRCHILKFSGDSYRIKDFLTQLNITH